MIILVKETKRIAGKQSLVQEGKDFFLVSSVSNPAVDKTFIVKCDKNGKVKDWNEVYTLSPSDHERTLNELETGVLSVKDFNFVR